MSLLLSHKTQTSVNKDIGIPFLFLAVRNHQHLLKNNEKRHRLIPFHFRASMTLEASVVLPLVIFAIVFVLMFFRFLAVSWGMAISLQEVARRGAVYGSVLDDTSPGNEGESSGLGALSKGALIASTYSEIAAKKVPVKFINLGEPGIYMLSSKVNEKDIDLIATYTMNMPFRIFGNQSYTFSQRARVRRWNGYDPHEDDEDGEYVYVTEHGEAYHRRLDCTYLTPSITSVIPGKIPDSRNESGGKYYPCSICHNSDSRVFFITKYGDVYHSSILCSSLKRNIRRELIEEAIEAGYHPCSKCGG